MFNPHQTMAAKSDISEAVNSARQIGAARGFQPPQPQMMQPGMAVQQGQPMQPGMPVALPTMTMQGVPQPQGGPAQMMPPQAQGQPMGGPPGFQGMSPAIQQMIQQRLQQHMSMNPARTPGAWLQQQGGAPNGMAGLAARYGVAGGPQQAAQATGPLGALMTSASGPMGG